MGQKVHPGGFRVGVIHDWKSHWYTEKEFKEFLSEDGDIRRHILRKLAHAGLSRIIIRKDQNNVTIDIHTARPGIVIGKSGSEVDALRKEIHAMTHKNVQVNILEVKRPELDAVLVAQSIAEQLENRVSFRRAMKRALTSAMRSGRRRHARALRRPPGRRRDGAQRALQRGTRAAAHAARRHRLRLQGGTHHVRPHRRQGVDQQGRDPARGLPGRRGAGAPAARRGAPRRPSRRSSAAPRRRPRARSRRSRRSRAWSRRSRARSRRSRSRSRRARSRSRWSRTRPRRAWRPGGREGGFAQRAGAQRPQRSRPTEPKPAAPRRPAPEAPAADGPDA